MHQVDRRDLFLILKKSFPFIFSQILPFSLKKMQVTFIAIWRKKLIVNPLNSLQPETGF
jgi:hypothetical protein